MTELTKKGQSPFLDISSFEVEETEIPGGQETSGFSEVESPFRSIYEIKDQEGIVDQESEEFASFFTELYDQEFDEVVSEIINEAANLYESRFEGEYGGISTQGVKAERLLEEHFAPLIRETEAYLEALSEYLENRDPNSLSESEIDKFNYIPSTNLSPSFENFLKKIVKKIKKVAKKGLNLAKRGLKAVAKTGLALAKRGLKAIGKLGLGPVLNTLKRLIRPLLKNVLKAAIGKLPTEIQPIAKNLADKHLKKITGEAEEVFEGEEAAGNIAQIQYEFDLQLANYLFAEEEVEQEASIAEYITSAEQPALGQLDQLEHARTQFIDRLDQLKEGEDPAPALEEFIPALYPAMKLGIKLAGRKRVVDFLAKFVGKLINRFVGPKYTPMLSGALVDVGMRMMGFEATPENARQAAFEAIADTVEGTVREVAALPEYILDNEELLEGFVMEAFESSAAANLPPVLSTKVYQERPELRETIDVGGTWVRLPLRGRRYYKKYTRVFDVNITPHMAQTIKTWNGMPLAIVLQDLFRMPKGRVIKARVHLYEAIPGTWLSRISKFEKNVAGLGSPVKIAWSRIYPLTPQAATVILGQPRLGREVALKYLANPFMISNGQRFYYLEIPSTPIYSLSIQGAPSITGRCCQTHLKLDFPKDQIQVSIFLSESEAQKIALKLRQRMPMGPIMTLLRPIYAIGLKNAFSEGVYHQTKIIHGAMGIKQSAAATLKWLPPIFLEMLMGKLVNWVGSSLSQHLKQQERAQDFIASTENPAIGLTIVLQFNSPPGLTDIRRILAGEPVALRSIRFPDSTPNTQVQIVPGYAYE